MLLGSRLQEKTRNAVLTVIGLFTLLQGTRMFFETNNALVVLCALLVGTIIGEWLRIEAGLELFGEYLKGRFSKTLSGQDTSRFAEGFLTASILFCVGPMTILGAIQDGLTGDYSLLAIKSVLDGFSALAFASTMGVGVIFSILIILGFQGGISLLAAQIQSLVTPVMMDEMSAAGGVILAAIAISSLLNIKKIRSGNLLPALVLAPLFAALFQYFGIL